MGHQVIKQPDGRYAIFSSGTDTWVFYDATRQDVIDFYVTRAVEDAKRDTARTLDAVDEDPRTAYYQFAKTFAEANAYSKKSGGPVLAGPVDEELLAEWAEDEDGDDG